MNAEHLRLCSSAEWGTYIEDTLLPWVVGDADLGGHLLEVGPGPGLTTDLLRQRVQRVTAVEYDDALAAALETRLAGTNVQVVHGDATKLPMPNGSFTAAASFTMLHHVPSPELQDQLLAQVARVLQPGGLFVGVDSLDSPSFRRLHEGDICVPINPLTFADRLERAGFVDIDLAVWSIGLRFSARAPKAR
ncbi:MAG: class I SAM-dependent methyltransferase [Chloroflexi bacterium]|nr:class I SAM-dependent methyltransferase [Chloroflexota bacterium]